MLAGGSLRSYLNIYGSFDLTVLRIYLFQVMVGLRYLHVKKVAHGNLTCSNVLLNISGNVKLIDYGQAF